MVNALPQPAGDENSRNHTSKHRESDDANHPQVFVSDDLVESLVKLFKLLSDETRLRILYFLTQRDELHVRALCELLGESQPAVSHHLALLRVAGLIERRREGKHNFYGLKTRQFSTLLDMLFDAMPEGHRRIRIDDYMLTQVTA
ncbi:MAG: ArsR family transcriptional regulator [Planctomycetota bacterium]|nr:MAG: ArsR family transcriptional regulator [Planctomycetota bacterium]